MLDAVYVDTLEEKAIVGIQPKPAFLPLFEVAAAGEDRDVALFSSTFEPHDGECRGPGQSDR